MAVYWPHLLGAKRTESGVGAIAVCSIAAVDEGCSWTAVSGGVTLSFSAMLGLHWIAGVDVGAEAFRSFALGRKYVLAPCEGCM